VTLATRRLVIAGLALGLALVVVLPLLVTSRYATNLLVLAAAWSISTLGLTVWAISAPMRRLAFVPVSEGATMTFDLAVLGSMFVAHWYWTACAYAMARGCAAIVRARTPSKP